MTLPIIENIAAEIVTRLGQITTGNSYEFTAESVTRPRRIDRDFTPKNLSIVVDQSSEVQNDDMSYPGNPPGLAFDVTFNLYGFVRESDDATTSPAITENQMASAIKKAITEDSLWHTFDDNAIDANWGNIEPFNESSNLPFTSTDHNGVMIELVVSYRVSELNPYQVA